VEYSCLLWSEACTVLSPSPLCNQVIPKWSSRERRFLKSRPRKWSNACWAVCEQMAEAPGPFPAQEWCNLRCDIIALALHWCRSFLKSIQMRVLPSLPSLPIVSRFRNASCEHGAGNYRYLNYWIQACASCAKMGCGFSASPRLPAALSSPALRHGVLAPLPFIVREGWGSPARLRLAQSLYLHYSEADRIQVVT